MTKHEATFEKAVEYVRANAARFREQNYSIRAAWDAEGHKIIGRRRWSWAVEKARCGWRGFVRPPAKPKPKPKPNVGIPPMPRHYGWCDGVAWRKLCRLVEPKLAGIEGVPSDLLPDAWPAGTIAPHPYLVRDVVEAYMRVVDGCWRRRDES